MKSGYTAVICISEQKNRNSWPAVSVLKKSLLDNHLYDKIKGQLSITLWCLRLCVSGVA